METTYKEFESVKCLASDEGWDFEMLDPYCLRIQTRTGKYLYDVWCPRHKKSGDFLGYTIHNWNNGKYDRKVFDFEKYIHENNGQRPRRN